MYSCLDVPLGEQTEALIMSKTQQRPWTPEDIVANAPNWTLAGDAALLKHLQAFSEELFAKADETNGSLNKLLDDLDETSIRLDLVKNEFLSLQNTQFIESRVYDDDESLDTVDEVTVEKKVNDEECKSALQSAVLDGLEILNRYYDKVSVPASDSEDEDGDAENYVLRMKDPYVHRPLPYVIGTEEWHKKWHVGLEESSSESEGEDVGEKYSESDSESNLPVMDRRGVSTSDSGTDLSNKLDRPIANSTINDTAASTDSEDYNNSIPAKAPISSSSFAEQLAARLGTVVQSVQEAEAPEEPVNTRPIQTAPTHTRIMGDILSDEPPPLEEEKPSQGMFSGGDGLFDDSDENVDFYGTPKAPQKAKADGKKVPNLFDDNEDDGIFSRKEKMQPENPKIINRGLFDEEGSDDDMFAPSKPVQPSFLKPFSTAPPLVPDEPPEIWTAPKQVTREVPDSGLNVEQRPKKIGLFDNPVDLFKDDLFSDAGLFGSPPGHGNAGDDLFGSEVKSAKANPQSGGGLFGDGTMHDQSKTKLLHDDDGMFASGDDSRQNMFGSSDKQSKNYNFAKQKGGDDQLFTSKQEASDDELFAKHVRTIQHKSYDDAFGSSKQMKHDGLNKHKSYDDAFSTSKEMKHDDFKAQNASRYDDGLFGGDIQFANDRKKMNASDDDLFGNYGRQSKYDDSKKQKNYDDQQSLYDDTNKQKNYDDGLLGGDKHFTNDSKKQDASDDDLFGNYSRQSKYDDSKKHKNYDHTNVMKNQKVDDDLFGTYNRESKQDDMTFNDQLFDRHDKKSKNDDINDDQLFGSHDKKSKNNDFNNRKTHDDGLLVSSSENNFQKQTLDDDGMFENHDKTATNSNHPTVRSIKKFFPSPEISKKPSKFESAKKSSKNLFDEDSSGSEDDLFAGKGPAKAPPEYKPSSDGHVFHASQDQVFQAPPAFSLFEDVPPPDEDLWDARPDDPFDEEDMFEEAARRRAGPPKKQRSLFDDDDDVFDGQHNTSARRVMSLFDDEPPSLDFSKPPGKSPAKQRGNEEASEIKPDLSEIGGEDFMGAIKRPAKPLALPRKNINLTGESGKNGESGIGSKGPGVGEIAAQEERMKPGSREEVPQIGGTRVTIMNPEIGDEKLKNEEFGDNEQEIGVDKLEIDSERLKSEEKKPESFIGDEIVKGKEKSKIGGKSEIYEELGDKQMKSEDEKLEIGVKKPEIGPKKSKIEAPKPEIGDEGLPYKEKFQTGDKKEETGDENVKGGEKKPDISGKKPEIARNKPEIGDKKINGGDKKLGMKPEIGQKKINSEDKKPEIGGNNAPSDEEKLITHKNTEKCEKSDEKMTGKNAEIIETNVEVVNMYPQDDSSGKLKRESPGKLKHKLNINVGALMPGAPLPWRKDVSVLSKSHSLEERGVEDGSERRQGLVHAQSCKDVRDEADATQDNNNGEVQTLNSITKTRARIPLKRKPSTRKARQESMRRTRRDETNNNSHPPDKGSDNNPADINSNLDPQCEDPLKKRDIDNLRSQSAPKVADLFNDNKIGGGELAGNLFQESSKDDRQDIGSRDEKFEDQKPRVMFEQRGALKSGDSSDWPHSFPDEHITTPPADLFGNRPAKQNIFGYDARPHLNLFDDDPGDFFPRNKPGALFSDEEADLFAPKGSGQNPAEAGKPKSAQKSRPSLFEDDDEADLFGAVQARKHLKVEPAGAEGGSRSLFHGNVKGVAAKKVVGKKGSLFGDVSEDNDIFSTVGAARNSEKSVKVPDRRASRGRSLIRRSEERHVVHDPLDALSRDSPE